MIHEAYFLGMHLIWWAVWFILITAVTVYRFDPLHIQSKKKVQLDLLEKRYTAGDISSAEYRMRKDACSELMPPAEDEMIRYLHRTVK
jgi:uncharacterized membrane protein